MNLSYLKQQLTRHEGSRLKPYKDTVGKTTIGVGRNLDDVGIFPDEEELMLTNDINRAIKDLDDHLSWANSLDEPRKMVLVNLCFNIGITRLLGFQKMLIALQSGDYTTAAKEMMDSLWAKQVKYRAVELAHQMETGDLM